MDCSRPIFRLQPLLCALLVSGALGACESEGDVEFGVDTDTEGMGDAPLETPRCHPLLQDCAGDLSCVATGDARSFDCLPTVSDPGGFADPCFFGSDCGEGYFCSAAEIVVGCADGFGCCAPFCDVQSTNPGCGATLSCVPYFGDDVPPGFEDVGACAYAGG